MAYSAREMLRDFPNMLPSRAEEHPVLRSNAHSEVVTTWEGNVKVQVRQLRLGETRQSSKPSALTNASLVMAAVQDKLFPLSSNPFDSNAVDPNVKVAKGEQHAAGPQGQHGKSGSAESVAKGEAGGKAEGTGPRQWLDLVSGQLRLVSVRAQRLRHSTSRGRRRSAVSRATLRLQRLQ